MVTVNCCWASLEIVIKLDKLMGLSPQKSRYWRSKSEVPDGLVERLINQFFVCVAPNSVGGNLLDISAGGRKRKCFDFQPIAAIHLPSISIPGQTCKKLGPFHQQIIRSNFRIFGEL